MANQSTPNPISRGGGGTLFEQHVGAYWLAQLLTGSIPLIWVNAIVSKVSFQTKHLGWNTDDFLIECIDPNEVIHRFAGQVKLGLNIRKKDQDFISVIKSFWNDFNASARFSKENDRLVLVVQYGTENLLRYFKGLLDCARAAEDHIDFNHRLNTEGYISKTSVDYYNIIRTIITDTNDVEVSEEDIWSFLRILHVLNLDLNTPTSQTESNIRNLLAYTAHQDKVVTADASWNKLLAIVGNAMPSAQSLTRDKLPQELLDHHEPIGINEHRVLHNLRNHTAPILDTIRSEIGPDDFHLQRTTLAQDVLAQLEAAQVTIISGPAGSGKSAIAKNVVTFLSKEHFVFAFRAEEFAKPHIDKTLADAQIPMSFKGLTSILAGQPRKVLLIESIERLLEKSTRDAFSDLIKFATKDIGLRIILTCRDYSVEQVRASFLQHENVSNTIVRIPYLNDEELAEVESKFPALKNVLQNLSLRRILHNPYFLDKAFDIPWGDQQSFPENERAFRDLFWKQIVRSEKNNTPQACRSREDAFQKVAVRRARSLSNYVEHEDIDQESVLALLHDSLLIASKESALLVAPAHDVLEDWAILHWLGEQHHLTIGRFEDMSRIVGAYPAIRRTYRKWLGELIESDPDAADHLFVAAISEIETNTQFCDETLIALLKATALSKFLELHKTQLLSNERATLKRLIHLLRVACVTTPNWPIPVPTLFNVPDGPEWTTMLRFIHEHADSFNLEEVEERLLLLGLVEDATRGISLWGPEIDGAEYVADIAFRLLTIFNNDRDRELCERVLKVIARIPQSFPSRFEDILRGIQGTTLKLEYTTEKIRELIYSGLDGMTTARYLPDLIVDVAKDYLLTSKNDLQRRYDHYDLEISFGINPRLSNSFFPPSANRGPWIHLLRFHTYKALNLLIHIVDHGTSQYVQPQTSNLAEFAYQIELTLPNGNTQLQWGNPRLWCLYRGISVGPDMLKSILMALERWLLELAEQHGDQLDDILLYILRRSNSTALAAVVASVATAYPHESGKALLVLLTAPDYFRFDKERLVAGESSVSRLTGLHSLAPAENEFYVQERRESNLLPHRQHDLEWAIRNLQLGPLAPRIHAILDKHLNELPPIPKQSESDRLWRLAIHRMDLRQYTISNAHESDIPEGYMKDDNETKNYLLLNPKAVDPDIQTMIDEKSTEFEGRNARLSILMWGLHAFKRDDMNHDPSQWQTKLTQARQMESTMAQQEDGSENAPGIIAAVCTRDHWDTMTDDERDWCINLICSEILRDANQWDDLTAMQLDTLSADRACASVVALLLSQVSISHPRLQDIQQAFSLAITHPVDEVRWHAVRSIDKDFWARDFELAKHCVNAIAMQATLIDEAWKANLGRSHIEFLHEKDILAKATKTIRDHFWQQGEISDDAYIDINYSSETSLGAIIQILSILEYIPKSSLAIDLFKRASQALVDWWIAKDNRSDQRSIGSSIPSNRFIQFLLQATRNIAIFRPLEQPLMNIIVKISARGAYHNQSSNNLIYDYKGLIELSNLIAHFLMRTTPAAAKQIANPILEVMNQYPKEIYYFIQELTRAEFMEQNTEQYWYLWGLFVDSMQSEDFIDGVENRYPTVGQILPAIFLASGWDDGIRHSMSVEGYADRVHNLFKALPPSSLALNNYLRFLYHIGEQSLPDAFIHIHDSLIRGNEQAMLKNSETTYLLEILLQRYVYGRPLELKKDESLRIATLYILDTLIENGSSAAFRMRDDFATPVE